MKVLIIRFSSIGDIILTSPVIRCAAKQLNAEVHFLTKPSFKSLVEYNPFINQVHVLKEYGTTIDELKLQNFDLIIDLHCNIRSKKIGNALGVKTYTYNKSSIKRILLTTLKIDLLKGTHIVDRYFTAFKDRDVVNDHKGLAFYYPKQSLNQLPKNYIVIAIGTAHFTKNLPKDLIEELIKSYGLPIILIGGKEHRDFANGLVVPNGKKLINLVGETSLLESAALIEKAALIISPDTGMMHLAAALNTPTIAIYGSTSSKLGFTPYMKADQFEIIENNQLSCRPCTKQGRAKCPKGHFKCMKELKSQEIVDKSMQLIDI